MLQLPQHQCPSRSPARSEDRAPRPGLRALSPGSAGPRSRNALRKCFRSDSAIARQTAVRGHLKFLRTMPSQLGNCRARPLARPGRRSLPALPPGQQQVLQRRRSPHQLRCLSRPASECCPRRFLLRLEMSRLPQSVRSNSYIIAASKSVPGCEVALCHLSYATGVVTQWPSAFH